MEGWDSKGRDGMAGDRLAREEMEGEVSKGKEVSKTPPPPTSQKRWVKSIYS